MILHLENICKIRQADIEIKGLTVIAGNNGTGKSTIGKMLFSTLKVLEQTSQNDEKQISNVLLGHIETLYKRVRRFIPTSHTVSQNTILPSTPRRLLLQLETGQITFEDLEKGINSLIETNSFFTLRDKGNIQRDLHNIRICLNNKANRAAVQASVIQKYIESEFINGVCSHGEQCSKVKLKIIDHGDAEFAFSISQNIVDAVNMRGKEFIEDATYVESPLYLHLLDTLMRSSLYTEVNIPQIVWFNGMIPTHIRDFAEKMDYAAKLGIPDPHVDINREKPTTDTIHGSFIYNKKMRSLVFESNGTQYSPINTASGIKTFGILQLLLRADCITPNKMLIWDEPENHLHPEWQIKFADILVQQVKNGIPMLLSTHSPYFLQAIRYAAAKYGIEEEVKYYFAKDEGNDVSTVEDATENLNIIFQAMALPMANVINLSQVTSNDC